jgi:hypothetical protein
MIKKQLTIANCIRLSLILILTYLIVFSTQALVALIHSNHILINLFQFLGNMNPILMVFLLLYSIKWQKRKYNAAPFIGFGLVALSFLINIANKEGSFKFDFVFTTYDSVMLVVCSFILSIVIVYLGEYCYLTFSKSK